MIKNIIKKFFEHNLQAKLLSILFAFFMWLFVMVEVDPMVTRTFDNLEIENITNQAEIDELGLAVSPESNLSIQAQVRGRSSEVNKFISDGVKVIATIEDPKEGPCYADVKLSNADNLEVEINPSDLSITLENISSAKKSVKVKTVGKPKENYVVGKTTIEPASTLIGGPESLVDSVAEVIAFVDVTDASDDVKKNTKLIPIDKNGNEVLGVNLQVRFGEAVVEIEKSKSVPVDIVFESSEIDLSGYLADPSKVVIQGDEKLIDTVKSIKTKPISLEKLMNYKQTSVQLELPEGIKADTYLIKLKENIEQTFSEEYKIKKEDLVFQDEYTEQEYESLISALPEVITVTVKYSNGLENMINDKLTVYVKKDKTSENGYYLDFETDIPYINSSITPNIINIID